jgi:hypothetical protein
MKTFKLTIGLAALLLAGITAQAQSSIVTNANGTITTTVTTTNGSIIGTTITTVPMGYVAPAASVPWYTELYKSLTSGTNFSGATNWAAIPFASYDLTTKQVGGGAAILYQVNQNFWTGVRIQSIGGITTTAGVQAQLQVTKTLWGVNYTPFVETSVGLGQSTLYGSVGAGALIQIHTWDVWNKHRLGLGVVGDYEHYVTGSTHGNQINGGLLLTLDI